MPYTPRTERDPVVSSLIAAIGFDEPNHIIEVEMLSGDIYGYGPAEPELYQAFREAASKGIFYNERIKNIVPRYSDT